MRIRVTRDHDHVPADNPRVTIAFKGGREITTKRAWGEALVAAGAAEEIAPPARPAATEDDDHAADDAPRG